MMGGGYETDQNPPWGLRSTPETSRAVMKDREAHRPKEDVEGDGITA